MIPPRVKLSTNTRARPPRFLIRCRSGQLSHPAASGGTRRGAVQVQNTPETNARTRGMARRGETKGQRGGGGGLSSTGERETGRGVGHRQDFLVFDGLSPQTRVPSRPHRIASSLSLGKDGAGIALSFATPTLLPHLPSNRIASRRVRVLSRQGGRGKRAPALPQQCVPIRSRYFALWFVL